MAVYTKLTRSFIHLPIYTQTTQNQLPTGQKSVGQKAGAANLGSPPSKFRKGNYVYNSTSGWTGIILFAHFINSHYEYYVEWLNGTVTECSKCGVKK